MSSYFNILVMILMKPNTRSRSTLAKNIPAEARCKDILCLEPFGFEGSQYCIGQTDSVFSVLKIQLRGTVINRSIS